MLVKRLDDAAAFLRAAGSLLLADEARHNLVLGIVGTLRDHPHVYPEHDLRVVERDGGVVAAGLRTPPYNLLVVGEREGLRELARVLHSETIALPGVTGAVPEVDAFAAAWGERSGARATVRSRQRIYRLSRLVPPRPTSGAARVATEADRELLVAWVAAFARETKDEVLRSPEATVEARLATGGFTLWEADGVPVSLAGCGSWTPNGARIGPVYTPPEHRGRGYGSSVTAAASAEQLAAGRAFCFLYTDLENPTSNKIYMDLGYEPVCDSLFYAFVTR